MSLYYVLDNPSPAVGRHTFAVERCFSCKKLANKYAARNEFFAPAVVDHPTMVHLTTEAPLSHLDPYVATEGQWCNLYEMNSQQLKDCDNKLRRRGLRLQRLTANNYIIAKV